MCKLLDWKINELLKCTSRDRRESNLHLQAVEIRTYIHEGADGLTFNPIN